MSHPGIYCVETQSLVFMLLLIFVLILIDFVLLMFIFRPVLEAVSSNVFVFICMSSNLLDISAMSSANSRSSSLFIKFHLIPVLLPSTHLHITQSSTRRNKKPDMLHPCFTPEIIFIQSVCMLPFRMLISVFLYSCFIISTIFFGIP